ncbi:hypothetical protein LKL05_004700, partial [Escherichia coli]|nr:hypothetical protein [Escherichia coli]
MKNINISDFDPKNTLVDTFKVSGFDVVVTDVKGDRVRIIDALPELLLGNLKLKNADGHNIDPTEIVSSIDASKLGLDVAVLGGLLDGADMKGSSQKELSDKKEDDNKEDDNKRLTELLNENKKLKEELADAQQPKESPNKIEVIAERTETITQQYQEPPLEESVPKIYTPKKPPQLILDDAGGSSVSSSQGANPSRQEGSDVPGNASTTLNDAIPLVAHLSDKSDTGVTGDNITGCNKPVFTGTTVPEAEVTLTIGGKTYSTKADVNGRWNITVSDPLPEGSNPYTVQAIASNGASGTLQGGVVIDTQAQEITVSLSSASDTGVKGDFITQVTTPTFNGTAEAGARLTLAIGSSVYTFAADASGRWSFTLPEQLQDGVHQYTLTATDIAGNICTGTGSVTIDTTGPELTQQIDPSNQILTGNMISNVQPTFSGKTEPGVRLTISIADNTYNVIVDDTGRWSFTVPMALENKIWDYQITATDLAGNQTILKEQIVINHQESVANIPVTGGLNISTDSGIVGDKITNFKKISFTGITEPGATINLIIADKNYTGKADEQGNWIVYVEEELQDGTYDYIVTATGSAGATGIFNGYVTVDTCQPNANVALASGSDSGVKGDCITNITLPVLTGNTEPNTLVQINIGGVDYETISDNYGQWSVTIKSPLNEGDNIYTIQVKDAAGNSSNATGILKIDTTSPSLSGIKFGDGFDDRCTNTYTPTIIGWGEAGATVDIIIGSRKYSVIVPDNRQWQFKVPKGFIAEGNKVQYITFVETDVAGNKTEQKIKFQFITEKPIINADISHSTDTDIIGDKITSNTKPILEGTVINTAQTPAQIAKAKVSVYIDGKEYNNISVDKNGHWTFQLPQ